MYHIGMQANGRPSITMDRKFNGLRNWHQFVTLGNGFTILYMLYYLVSTCIHIYICIQQSEFCYHGMYLCWINKWACWNLAAHRYSIHGIYLLPVAGFSLNSLSRSALLRSIISDAFHFLSAGRHIQINSVQHATYVYTCFHEVKVSWIETKIAAGKRFSMWNFAQRLCVCVGLAMSCRTMWETTKSEASQRKEQHGKAMVYVWCCFWCGPQNRLYYQISGITFSVCG